MNVADVRGELARASWSIGSHEKSGLRFHWAGPKPQHPPPFDPLARAKLFARYHRAKDWSAQEGVQQGDGLMYTYVLGEDVIYQTRDLDAVLYATGTEANATAVHALFPVFEGESPTPGMWRAGAALRRMHPVWQPLTHRDEGTSFCPGDEIYAWVHSPLEEDDMRPPTREEYAAGFEPFVKETAELMARLYVHNVYAPALQAQLNALAGEFQRQLGENSGADVAAAVRESVRAVSMRLLAGTATELPAPPRPELIHAGVSADGLTFFYRDPKDPPLVIQTWRAGVRTG